MTKNIIEGLRLLLISDVVKQYPQYGSVSAWHWRIYQENKNGLKEAGVIIRSLGRVYINVDAWETFMLSPQADNLKEQISKTASA